MNHPDFTGKLNPPRISDHEPEASGKSYSPKFGERAVLRLLEHRPEHASEVAAPRALAEKLGRSSNSLRI